MTKEAKHQDYLTKVYYTEEEAWIDLEDYMKKNMEYHMLFLRVSPEVSREYNYDTKKKEYRGYVRFSSFGKLKDSNTIAIPSLGAAYNA